MNFDEWWESEIKANGGALIGAEYRHWAHRGFMAAKLDVPEANCGNMPLPEPAGFRTRYRSEPGMIGHYPWTYADAGRRKGNRPECEYEDLFTADQMRAVSAAGRKRCAAIARAGCLTPPDGGSPTEEEAALCVEIERRILAETT